MTSIAQVAEGIYRIDCGPLSTKTGENLNCSLVYLVISDGETALIDTGPARGIPAVISAIRELGYDPSRLSYAILTHIHIDHAGGAGQLAQQFHDIKVLVHQRGARHLIDPIRLIEGTRKAIGESFEADYGPILPVPERQVQAIEDGKSIALGTRELRIIYTAGHAPHHLCVYDSQSRGLFSGDSLGFLNNGKNTIIIVEGFDLDETLESIDRMKALSPQRVFAAHGTADREAGEFIQSVKDTTRDYGNIILEAMKRGKTEKEMALRLLDYQQERDPGEPEAILRRFEDIIPWYMAHFKKKGVA